MAPGSAGFATLAVDLLTVAEQLDRSSAPDLEGLAARLIMSTRWLRRQPETARLPVGYLVDRWTAEAALLAAARLRAGIPAVVLYGEDIRRAPPRRGRLIAAMRLIDSRSAEQIGRIAAAWFTRHLSEPMPAAARDGSPGAGGRASLGPVFATHLLIAANHQVNAVE